VDKKRDDAVLQVFATKEEAEDLDRYLWHDRRKFENVIFLNNRWRRVLTSAERDAIEKAYQESVKATPTAEDWKRVAIAFGIVAFIGWVLVFILLPMPALPS
jgi:hypothetical protein